MRGHQWNSTEGTIIDVNSRRQEHTYTIGARNGLGVPIRGTVRHKSPTAYPIGSKVRIEVDEHNQMRFDQSAPGGDPLIAAGSMSDQIAEAAAAFDDPWTARGPNFGEPGSRPAFGTSGGRTVIVTSGGGTVQLGGAAGHAFGLAAGLTGPRGGSTAHVIGPDGQQMAVDPVEVSRLTQAMLSGDPAAKQAAMERLRQIKAALDHQVVPPDAVPAGDGLLGASSGGSAEQRLAALEQLLSRGLVTQDEYDSQRQRIIESI